MATKPTKSYNSPSRPAPPADLARLSDQMICFGSRAFAAVRTALKPQHEGDRPAAFPRPASPQWTRPETRLMTVARTMAPRTYERSA